MWNLKNDAHELTDETGKDSDTEQTCYQEGKRGEGKDTTGIWIRRYTPLHVKQINKDLL